jgi:hypothetical protein
MDTGDLVAEIIPEIEEAYKTSVCGYIPFIEEGEGGSSAMTAKDRWTHDFEVWLPIPKVVFTTTVEGPRSVCERLTTFRYIKSARFIDDALDAPAHISEMVGSQDLVIFHVICVPFKDLALV